MRTGIAIGLGLSILSLASCQSTSTLDMERKQVRTGLSINDISFSTDDLIKAYPGSEKYNPGRYFIALIFSESGEMKFQKLKRDMVGKPLTIKFDATIISSPILVEIIPDNEVQISGGFTEEEAQRIAVRLSPTKN
ncbi:MAG: hypothetical protein AB8B54_14630 [Sphingorhabdus sp.]